jgi:hypothetical protein
VNGIRKVASSPAPTALTFAITDLSGAPIASNGPGVSCQGFVGEGLTASWVGKLTPFTLGSQPLGWLDGPNGAAMRRLAVGTANGLTSLVVSSNVATVTTSYPHGMTAGDGSKVAIYGAGTGTSAVALMTGNGTTAGCNGSQCFAFGYTVTVTSPTTFTFPTVGVANGTYTGVNNACGPASPPNDLRGGTQDCLRISQLAYVGNPTWDSLLANGNPDNDNNGHTGPNVTRSYMDGGFSYPGSTLFDTPFLQGIYAMQFLVDPTNDHMLAATVYGLTNAPHIIGVNWSCYTGISGCGDNSGSDYISQMLAGYAWVYPIGAPYLTAAHKQTFLDQMYNDVDDPNAFIANTADADMFGDAHHDLLASGFSQAGDATHITLAASDQQPDHYYEGTVVGVAIPPGGFYSGTYVSGVTAVGAAGTRCKITNFVDPSGYSGYGWLYLVGTNTIAPGSPIQFTRNGNGGGYSTYPTSATAVSDSATCSGTATITSVTGAPHLYYALITNYVAATKVATISGSFADGWNVGTTAVAGAGQQYKIYSTAIMSDRTPLASGVTITGTHTSFTSDFAVGDAISMGNGWFLGSNGNSGGNYPGASQSVVTAITDDTHMTVRNSGAVSGSTTVPAQVWIYKKWKTGDVGLSWMQKHWVGQFGVSASLYPVRGGDNSAVGTGAAGQGGNNNIASSFGHMALAIATAADDPRAIRELAWHQSYGFDYELQGYLNYLAGPGHSGAGYSLPVINNIGTWANILKLSFPTFPALDYSGPWANSGPLYLMYSVSPDMITTQATPNAWQFPYGAETGDNDLLNNNTVRSYYGTNSAFLFNPGSTISQYWRYWLEHATSNFWTGTPAKENDQNNLYLLANDPRIKSSDYTVQPFQYAFKATSAATCASVTGWPCPASLAGGAMISRTGWTDRTSTLLYYGTRTYISDHDQVEGGTVRISKVGGLLNIDSGAAPGLAASGLDETTYGDLLQFGSPNGPAGSTLLRGQAAGNINTNEITYVPITRWASGNHGTWDPAYGDQNSKYAYVCSDLAGQYNNPINYALRCVVDLKDKTLNGGTGEQIIIQQDSVDVTGHPIDISTHLHYIQNGQGIQTSGGQQSTYTEGQTTCPGAGGCAALNTNRQIQSLEDGSTDNFNPARNYGILTKFFSPGTITVRDDSFPVTVSSVTKTVIAAITALTPGNPTLIQTATAHGLISGENVSVSFTGGTGNCNGSGIAIVADSTHFAVGYDSTTCSGPTGGTSTSPTLFNATAHGLAPQFAAISSISNASAAVITTATPHGLYMGQGVQINGVASTNNKCIGINVLYNNRYPATVIDATHFSIPFNTLSCSGLTGGVAFGADTNGVSITGATGSWAAFNAPTHSGTQAVTSSIYVIDADHFSIELIDWYFGTAGPADTSGYSGTFNGTVTSAFHHSYGGAHRVTICSGPQCGQPVNTYESLIVHKISQNYQTDTTITAAPLAPDANWYGVQTNDKVVVLARGGVTHSTMTGFTTTHAGTAQYLFGGLTAGTYAVNIGGSPVAGSPFTVTGGDNSIHFESTAGAVTLSGSSIAPPAIVVSPATMAWTCTAGFPAPGTMKLNIASSGNPLDNWSATKTQSWTTLSASSGTATANITVSVDCTGLTPGSYTDTISVASNTAGVTNSPRTVALSITVAGAPACHITTSLLPNGTTGTPYSQTLSTSNCSGAVTWSVSSGTICAGLSLASGTGVISGTPTTAQTCSFSARAVDTVPTTATQPLLITIAGGAAQPGPASGVKGKANASGNVIVH